MSVFRAADRHFLSSVASLGYANPFLPERIAFEKAALGREFQAAGPVWSVSVAEPDSTPPNVTAIYRKLGEKIGRFRDIVAAASEPDPEDLTIYEECVHYLLYQRYYEAFSSARSKADFYREFLADWNHLLHIQGRHFDSADEPAHVFACLRQIHRAFHHVYDKIVGNSMPAARLRASVWQSIFTQDMRRYRRVMYRRLGEFPTLITGPSGTGKELIARAIAGSRYVAFDAQRMEFADPKIDAFLPINIAALSPALVESELFGHRRGSFTGAITDRKGWLEICPPSGCVFLDELAEMGLAIEVKLLRVLETRRFSPVGDTSVREFHGKLIAATNRNLPEEIRAGRFREDLYYRLCADQIHTPSLAEQIEDSPTILRELIHYMVIRTVEEEADRCLSEVEEWIGKHIPRDYTWPGNYRELEQCVRNVIIRRSYRPLAEKVHVHEDDWIGCFRAATITADDLLSRYAAHVYRLTGSYEESARRMGLDRRTVQAKVKDYLTQTTARGETRNK